MEYSWRVYGTHYKNILRLFKEIPLRKDPNRCVYDNLVKIKTFLFPRKSGNAYLLPKEKGSEPLIQHFTWKDKWQILNKILFCVTISEKRMNQMDDLTWSDYCSDLSDEARKYTVRIWGPVLGMDPTYMSFPVVARMMKVFLGGYTGATGGLWVMNKPTNDGWFDEWEAYLVSTGHVTIKREHEIIEFEGDEKNLSGIKAKNLKTGEVIHDVADYVVCALSVETVSELVRKNKHLSKQVDLARIPRLAKTCRQVQLSVQLFINDTFVYPTKEKHVLYLPDTPWALIIEPEALIWDKTYSSDDRVKSVLSVGICQTDVKGTVHGKPFISCTPEEIFNEVIDQMSTSYHVSIPMGDGTPLGKEHVALFHLWDSFTYNPQTKRTDTWEPKFSNNAGSFQDQPSTTTSMKNLLFATGYTKTRRFIYSMESATEAGIRCANEVIKREGAGKKEYVYGFSHAPAFFKPLVWLDAIFVRVRLPHLGSFLGGSSNILVFLYSVILVGAIVYSIQHFF